MTVAVQSLSECDWTVSAAGDTSAVPELIRRRVTAGVPAAVPGCVHTDLLAAGLIEDPYLADNELRQFWIGHTDWRYACRFDVAANWLEREHLDLACDGLDTVATVSLNGQVIGRSENMHTAVRFDLKPAIRPGQNELSITFAAPRGHAVEQEKIYGHLPHTGHGSNTEAPHNMMRKMACNFGWDWGPDVATSGIWRGIRIEAWDVARIEAVRPMVSFVDEKALVRAHVDLSGYPDLNSNRGRAPKAEPASATLPRFEYKPGHPKVVLSATLTSPSGETVVSVIEPHEQTLAFIVENPELWWPVGHGAQPLYQLTVTLSDEREHPLDTWTGRVGLRTVELDTSPDAGHLCEAISGRCGEGMTIKVNNKPIYCKGANWIPDDCFPARITPARYRQRLTQARDANMNMLRIWGGGIYEDPAFYNTCDELGLLVWQDFMFACAFYPEEEPYRSLVEAEIRQNVARLCVHPCIVLWNGCNENLMAAFHWGEPWTTVREAGLRTWGLGYYFDLFPKIVSELDPSRPYWPGSPFSGDLTRLPNDNDFGNMHIWDVWHGPGNYRNYLSHAPRMASEFGYHGPACYATIERSIPPEERWWNSPMMQLHNKNGNPGQIQTNTRLADDFDPPTHDFNRWHFLAQVMQARALSMGIEWFRALAPWNSGALFWQLNDCYPVSSWSAIDGDGRAKPLLHAARRFFAPRLVTIKPRRVTQLNEADVPLRVWLHNDADEAWTGRCVLRQMTMTGGVVAVHEADISVLPRGGASFDVPDAMTHRPTDTFLVAQIGVDRGFWWFAPDKETAYAAPAFDAELTQPTDGVYHLTVHAQTVLRDLCVFPDRLDANATINESFVTLLPGERFVFAVRSDKPLTREQLTSPPVMDCVNRHATAIAARALGA